MGSFIASTDLVPFAIIEAAKAAAMIEDAEAQAILTAPCLPDLLVEPEDETAAALALRLANRAAVKSILRGAILRWNDAGSGVVTQQQVGPFGQTITQAPRRNMFWPSEIEQLQGICKGTDGAKSFAVDTVPTVVAHAPWCDITLGGTTCSCGADIAGYPIYGLVT